MNSILVPLIAPLLSLWTCHKPKQEVQIEPLILILIYIRGFEKQTHYVIFFNTAKFYIYEKGKSSIRHAMSSSRTGTTNKKQKAKIQAKKATQENQHNSC
jgi:hypothetical protein